LFIGWGFLKLKPLKYEVLGMIITLAGIIFMILDSSAERTDGKEKKTSVYLICLTCSLAGSVFFLLNAHLQNELPLLFIVVV
jgi:drug/metabolite transporter (DMT)-like permease